MWEEEDVGVKKKVWEEEDVGVKKKVWEGGTQVWEKGGDGGGWSMSVEDLLLEEHGEHHLIGLLGETGEEEDLVGCLLA